jgi:hypothetical protein
MPTFLENMNLKNMFRRQTDDDVGPFERNLRNVQFGPPTEPEPLGQVPGGSIGFDASKFFTPPQQPMSGGIPPITSPTPPVVPPEEPLYPAMQAYQKAIGEVPQREDYRPSPLRTILASATGGLQGYASRDPGAAFSTGMGISELPYSQAMQEYQTGLGPLQKSAELEGQLAGIGPRNEYYKAMADYYDARTAGEGAAQVPQLQGMPQVLTNGDMMLTFEDGTTRVIEVGNLSERERADMLSDVELTRQKALEDYENKNREDAFTTAYDRSVELKQISGPKTVHKVAETETGHYIIWYNDGTSDTRKSGDLTPQERLDFASNRIEVRQKAYLKFSDKLNRERMEIAHEYDLILKGTPQVSFDTGPTVAETRLRDETAYSRVVYSDEFPDWKRFHEDGKIIPLNELDLFVGPGKGITPEVRREYEEMLDFVGIGRGDVPTPRPGGPPRSDIELRTPRVNPLGFQEPSLDTPPIGSPGFDALPVEEQIRLLNSMGGEEIP